MTEAAQQAVSILRDGSQFQWYWVHDMKSMRAKLITVGGIWAVDAAAVLVFGLALGWL